MCAGDIRQTLAKSLIAGITATWQFRFQRNRVSPHAHRHKEQRQRHDEQDCKDNGKISFVAFIIRARQFTLSPFFARPLHIFSAIIKSVADGEMQATLVTFFGTETFLPSMSMTVIEPPLLPPIREETAMPMPSDSDRTKRMGSNFFILNFSPENPA